MPKRNWYRRTPEHFTHEETRARQGRETGCRVPYSRMTVVEERLEENKGLPPTADSQVERSRTRHWDLRLLIKDAARSPILVERFSVPSPFRSLASASLLGCRSVALLATSRPPSFASLGVIASSLPHVVVTRSDGVDVGHLSAGPRFGKAAR